VAVSNEIVLENQKPGNPESEWGLNSWALWNNGAIEGFATDISANIGGHVDFKISSQAANYRIDIYRVGYYGGDGARKVASIEHHSDEAFRQPDALFDPVTRMADAGNWQVTDGWDVPADAVSGVYLAKLVCEDGVEGENHIPFIIRDDDGGSDVVFQTSDTTWQAYNPWGGASLYDSIEGGGILERASAVSYNRPVQTQGPYFFMGPEFTAIQFLEKNGFDVSYISGVDTARSGDELLEHKLFLSVGHDEYWAGEQRDNVEAARDAGVNLAFWSGNEVYWKTRWETSIDDSGTPYRTLVCYKEGGPDAVDPSDEWTGLWRDERNEGDPENSLTGTMFKVNSYREDTISVSDAFSDLRFWANTRVANLKPGQTTKLAPGTLGYEWDVNPDNGFRPEGLINLSSTKVLVDPSYLFADPSDTPGAPTVHNLTLYRAPSGALVFGAGSAYWSWALDSHNLGLLGSQNLELKGLKPVDPAAQQAMINLLADMGIQPSTLQSGLVHATQSTDHEAPTTIFTGSKITGSKFTGSLVAVVGRECVIFGHSDDPGGGVVAGIEFSADGNRWHYANGTANWAFSWTPTETGSFQVQARAIDDSLNMGVVAETTVTVYDDLVTGTSRRDLIVSDTAVFAKGSAAAKGKVNVEHSTSGDDVIFAKAGKDVIHGLEGNDRIDGGRGGDKILGGLGQDVLIGAGGHDMFKFNAAIDSTAAAPDLIVDFHSGRDKIDLRGMALADAQFIGKTAFSSTAGELRFDSSQRLLEGDLDGDGVADFAVKLGAGHIATHDLLF
jgi:Ca2+-binding RTX toxin-like protein